MLTIGNVLRKLEQDLGLVISQDRIRYYEELGLVKPRRTKAKFRAYSQLDYQNIKKIVILTELGIPPSEIKSNSSSQVDTRLKFIKTAILELEGRSP